MQIKMHSLFLYNKMLKKIFIFIKKDLTRVKKLKFKESIHK